MAATVFPIAVLRIRWPDDDPDPAGRTRPLWTTADVRAIVETTSNWYSIPSYWSSVTQGAFDLSGSRVFEVGTGSLRYSTDPSYYRASVAERTLLQQRMGGFQNRREDVIEAAIVDAERMVPGFSRSNFKGFVALYEPRNDVVPPILTSDAGGAGSSAQEYRNTRPVFATPVDPNTPTLGAYFRQFPPRPTASERYVFEPRFSASTAVRRLAAHYRTQTATTRLYPADSVHDPNVLVVPRRNEFASNTQFDRETLVEFRSAEPTGWELCLKGGSLKLFEGSKVAAFRERNRRIVIVDKGTRATNAL